MSKSQSLYRRHRPRTFAEIVGQEHVVRTLRNAIEQGKVHHAYLFVGSRGTGKTSMAKILAATLNCQSSADKLEPCGKCELCTSIAAGSSLDVIEMDAASNNSVDDIRDLRDKVGFAPVSGRHKVYILDEAHMLTTAAWNAFLKTLEEPPPHTIFVLATTEADKVLPTVVDRCHRFDFTRPSVTDIKTVIDRVAAVEQITIPDEAGVLLARSATGSFRDALGLLEQLVAYAGTTVELADVLSVLGVADADLLFGAVDAVGAGDTRNALVVVSQLVDCGRDSTRFLADLEAHMRSLMVVQALGELPAELHISTERDERLLAQAQRIDGHVVICLLDNIASAYRAIKYGADARTQLELCLVKTAVARDHGGPPVNGPTVRSRLEQVERDQPVRVTSTASAVMPALRSVGSRSTGQSAAAALVEVEESPLATVTAIDPPVVTPVTPVDPPVTTADLPAITPVDLPTDTKAPSKALDLDSFRALWPAVVAHIQADSPMLAALLQDSQPTALANKSVTLAWMESAAFLKRKAEDPRNKEVIADAIAAVCGSRLRISFELRKDEEMTLLPPPQLADEELVARFVSEFDAQEIDLVAPEEG